VKLINTCTLCAGLGRTHVHAGVGGVIFTVSLKLRLKLVLP